MTGIIIMLTTAFAIPTMVIAWVNAVTRWTMTSSQPTVTNQMTFMIAEPAPASGFFTTRVPKGHST